MSEALALWAYSRILWRVGRSLGPRRLGQGHLQRAPPARPSLMASPFRIFQVDESMHGESVRRSTDRCEQKFGICSQEHRTETELYNWDGRHQDACTVTEELKLGSAKLRLACERQRCRQGQCRYPR